MELLIPGLILVALMVYASTKIKKSAAKAYETESIETEEFSIIKPEGFINPLNGNSDFAFEAYSKEFGQDHAEQFRQASAELLILDDANFDEQRDEICREVTAIISEKAEDGDFGRTVIIEAELEDQDVIFDSFFKLAARNKKIYRLRISVLQEYKDVYLDRINEMLKSFEIR